MVFDPRGKLLDVVLRYWFPFRYTADEELPSTPDTKENPLGASSWLFGRAPGPESDKDPPVNENAETTCLYAAMDGDADGTSVGAAVGEDGATDGETEGEEDG